MTMMCSSEIRLWDSFISSKVAPLEGAVHGS